MDATAKELTKIKRERQEKRILKLFREHKKLSCSQVFKLYNCKDTPITSIRRAVTNLSYNYKVVKTNETVIGFYGKNERIYKLV